MSKANLLKDPQYTNTQIYGSKQTNKSTQSNMNLQRIVLTSLEQELLKKLKKSQTKITLQKPEGIFQVIKRCEKAATQRDEKY